MVVNQRFLLDSGIFIKFYRGDVRAANLLDMSIKREDFVSVLTITELLVGFKEDKVQTVKGFLKQFQSLNITQKIADTASVLIKSNTLYFGKKAEHGIIDAFIAATAIEYNLTLVTLNRKHFEKLKHSRFRCAILKESDKEWNLIQ